MAAPISTESWRFNTWARAHSSPLEAGDGRPGHPHVARCSFRPVNRPGRLAQPMPRWSRGWRFPKHEYQGVHFLQHGPGLHP